MALFRSIKVLQTPFSQAPLFKQTAKMVTKSLKDNQIFLEVMKSPEVKALKDIFDKYKYSLRLAGGPVRDILSGKQPTDLDFATTATPDQMKAMFEAEGIRTINALGEKHGTITARINDKENFEVTTLRIDKVTDGRRAEVEYTTDWKLDANRRDLTINSMFLDMDGILTDYFDGQNDLEQRRIRFVGQPEQRITEDYLRILRYFRFYGRIATSPDEHEANTSSAIAQHAKGLEIVSGERIWMEWNKILNGNFSRQLTLKMIELGLAQYIGLPAKPNCQEFETVCKRSEELGLPLQPVTRIAALLETENDMLNLNSRLKLSAFERDLGLFVLDYRNTPQESIVQTFKYLIVDYHSKPSDCMAWALETLKYLGLKDEFKTLEQWQVPRLPVTGMDIIEVGCPKGRLVSIVTYKLKQIWKKSNFTATKEELMAKVEEVLENSHDKETIDIPQIGLKKKRKRTH